MEEIRLDKLDSSNPDDVCVFEKALYRVFRERKSDSWEEEQYTVNENDKRMSHRLLDVEDMVLYVVKKGDDTLGCMAANLNTEKIITFEEFGVKVPEEDLKYKVVEGLVFFLFEEIGNDGYKTFMHFSGEIYKDLKKMGYKYFYGKCPEKLKSMYSLAGFDEVERFNYKGRPLCLVKLDLELEG